MRTHLSRVFLLTLGIYVVASLSLLALPLGATEDEELPPVPWDSRPAWSPDGTRIAFISTRNGPGGIPNGPANVWVINVDGTGLSQLTDEGCSDYPTWSPDGTKIAYEAASVLWQVDVTTGTKTRITGVGRGGFEPDWHPTDVTKMLCWFQTSTDHNDIILINPQTCRTDKSGRRTLLVREGDDLTPRWSSDGSHIAFIGEIRDPGGGDSTWHLMTMNADGTNVDTHCEVSEWAGRLSWFPDGTKVLIDGGDVCNLSTQQVTSLFGEPIQEPDISRDGLRVVYADSTPDGQFLFIRNLDGSGLVQMTDPSGGHLAKGRTSTKPLIASKGSDNATCASTTKNERALDSAASSPSKRSPSHGKQVGAGISIAAILGTLAKVLMKAKG